ncbi:MAG: hypothetical protein GFH27_549285n94 [Chloroflexi bacterium AL-W]|nr:hypothetical protein [Chloroflexi bacterium AL-N1]NOK65606.1 hypothetical protein [Chloroflexi bacterium AL-N10]NOK74453.1 hypothetical protein [Chloroflexi bacterium AL-N5]NOK80639.1 hypothetical protein [Chloroflexi bacterium AL-W]NOK88711.1 hypothetical protein [Chloroflexi bacterium AL-N15]
MKTCRIISSVFPLLAAARGWQRLNVHLHAMIADWDRMMVAFFCRRRDRPAAPTMRQTVVALAVGKQLRRS